MAMRTALRDLVSVTGRPLNALVVVAQTNAMASLAARRTSHMLKEVVQYEGRRRTREEIDEIVPKRSPRLAPLPGLPGR
jgi:hypothetical protein